jgi:hypothetical protein
MVKTNLSLRKNRKKKQERQNKKQHPGFLIMFSWEHYQYKHQEEEPVDAPI